MSPPPAPEQHDAPRTKVSLADLVLAWRCTRIVLRLSGAADLAPVDGLAGRVRGALGHVLMEGASTEARQGRPCGFEPPCALDVLFRARSGVTPGLERPKPFVLRLVPQGRDLNIEMILFGDAADLGGIVAEALTRAIPRTMTEGGNTLPPVDGRRVESAVPADDLPVRGPVVLRLLSPLSLRRGSDQTGSFPAMVSSLGNRISGLALWHDLRLEADWRALRDQARQVRMIDHSLRRMSWTRTSGRQGGRRIPVAGLIGDIVLDGELDALQPLLSIGELCHAGSRTTLGMGQFTVLPAQEAG